MNNVLNSTLEKKVMTNHNHKYEVLVTGSGAGLGACITEALRASGHTVYEYDIKDGHDVVKPDIILPKDSEGLDFLINCAGVNEIAYLEDITDELWDKVLNTNAKGVMKMTQAYLPYLKHAACFWKTGIVINICSNAATTPMTSSACYNASKGALKILTAQMSRELTKRHGIAVFSVSPNKLDGTEMSQYIDAMVPINRGWSKEYAKEYQLKALPWHKETDPKELAQFIRFLVDNPKLSKNFTGCDIPFGLQA